MSSSTKVAILRYNAGNIKSVANALDRLGVAYSITADEAEIRSADRVIFPGVGHSGSTLASLRETGLDSLIPRLEQPVLGICLGMQMYCGDLEEAAAPGLGMFDCPVDRFPSGLKVPHMGWNTLETVDDPLFGGVDPEAYFYFVHSYFVPAIPETIGACTYGLRFSASIRKGNFWGVQFHPEKSGEPGERVLRNFLGEGVTA